MNEKLKQEVAFFKCIGDNDLRDLTRIAEHFYNLALEEVRKEVIQQEDRNSRNGLLSRSEEDNHILFFIDNLTK